MKITLHYVLVTLIMHVFTFSNTLAQDSDSATFKSVCAACHTIGGGKLIGPDLVNVQDRHTEEWIVKFVKSSQSVIKAGDKYADSIYKAYNQVLMPDHPNLTDAQVKGLIAFIKTQSALPPTTIAKTELPQGNSNRGRELFVGNIRFMNNGAACNSCHNVNIKGYMSGGALAKDLTHAVSRLSAEGVSGVISGLPFPQMKESYAAHPVTEQETADLTAFLVKVDKETPLTATSKVGSYLLIGGITGLVILLILYSFFWIKRKKRPVNFPVFKRQIKSD
ncbi:MAG TPA: c-type cytochrome [Ferruginibacter sp.]|nr:c-type cytochrome [Bacteroidota bacterium]HMT95965.1 c-type cytochrome [Ferruginibacter sp.]